VLTVGAVFVSQIISADCQPTISVSANKSLSFHLMAIFPGEPGLASFIGAKDDGSGSDN